MSGLRMNLEQDLHYKTLLLGGIIPQISRPPDGLLHTVPSPRPQCLNHVLTTLPLRRMHASQARHLHWPDRPGRPPASTVVKVFTVDGADALRVFALTKIHESVRTVARRGSCLQCCLNLGRLASARVLGL